MARPTLELGLGLRLGVALGWLVGCVRAQGCPNTGGVVAGSVLVTLAVVGVILAILAFIYWRKNKQKQGDPNHAKKAGGAGHAYDNPTFHGDVELGRANYKTPDRMVESAIPNEKDKGSIPLRDIRTASFRFPGYVPCQEFESPTKNQAHTSLERNGTPSKWLPSISLAGSGGNLRSLHKAGSHNSLDDTCTTVDPEVMSVSLQSQDIIGLGFNISGSMRDGIYVSQVHNRGPASESGCIKAGDRILSITISFENMVYEDALTILSYASPYPVRLQVQKAQSGRTAIGKEDPAVTSIQEGSVLHPVYRSQSMDDVSQLGKESFSFRIRRAQSEMKRGSSSKAREREREREEGKLRKWGGKQDVGNDLGGLSGEAAATLTKEPSDSNLSFPDLKINTSDLVMNFTDKAEAEVVVHEIPDKPVVKDTNDNEETQPVKWGVDIPVTTVIAPGTPYEIKPNEIKPDDIVRDEVMLSSTTAPRVETKVPDNMSTIQNRNSKDFAEAYKSLTDEDRMEVLRLSYEEPNSAEVGSLRSMSPPARIGTVEVEHTISEHLEASMSPRLEASVSAPVVTGADVNYVKSVDLSSNTAPPDTCVEASHKPLSTGVVVESEIAPPRGRRRRRRRRSSSSSVDNVPNKETIEEEKLDLTLAAPSAPRIDFAPELPQSPHPEFNLTIPPSPGAEIEIESDVTIDQLNMTDIQVDQLEENASKVDLKPPELRMNVEGECIEEDGEVNMGTNLGELEMEVPNDEEMRLELGRRLDAFIEDIDLGTDAASPPADIHSQYASRTQEPSVQMKTSIEVNATQPDIQTPSREDTSDVSIGVDRDRYADGSIGVDRDRYADVDISMLKEEGKMETEEPSIEVTLSSEDEEEAESVRAVLKDYFGDEPSWLSKFGFSDKTSQGDVTLTQAVTTTSTSADGVVESNTDATTVTRDEFDVPSLKTGSLDGKLLQEAKEEIRRRSDSSSQDSVSSLISSRSTSPTDHKVELDNPLREHTFETCVSADDVDQTAGSPDIHMSSGGLAYDITAAEFKEMQPELPPERMGEPTGGIAYYVSIDEDQFRAVPAKVIYDLESDDEPRPDLVRAWNREETLPASFQLTTSDVQREERKEEDVEHEGDRASEEDVPREHVLTFQPPKLNANPDGELTIDPNLNGNDDNGSGVSTPVESPTKITQDIMLMDSRPTDKITIVEHEQIQGTYTLTMSTEDLDLSDSEA